MLRLILRETNWGILGALFGFLVGFFLKIYLIDIVGLVSWGKYVTAQTFSSISETILSLGIPFIIIKFLPDFIEKDLEKAKRISNVFLKFSLIVGSLFVIGIFFLSDYINNFLYNDIDGLSLILILMCIHVPISMVFGVVISLYRAKLKIKEIVLYGNFISISLRATLTFIIFYYTNNIIYFILIELITQISVLAILLYLFTKNEFSIFVKSSSSEVRSDKKMINYGRKMFYNSIISFFSSQILLFIISIKLPMHHVGGYNILLSLTALTTFLLINLNKIFAPAISKLYGENKITELDSLYKKTTFLINLFTIPLVIILTIFSDEILSLYAHDMLQYKNYLFFMLAGGLLSLVSGSSGTLMIMAGLEKENLQIQFFRGVLLTIFSLLLIPIFGMKSVVILYVLFMLFVNASQLILINKKLKINPFSKELIFLIFLTVLTMFFSINQDYSFNLYHYILLPILIYLLFFGLMYKSVLKIIKEVF